MFGDHLNMLVARASRRATSSLATSALPTAPVVTDRTSHARRQIHRTAAVLYRIARRLKTRPRRETRSSASELPP
jgi:hypothetical protein